MKHCHNVSRRGNRSSRFETDRRRAWINEHRFCQERPLPNHIDAEQDGLGDRQPVGSRGLEIGNELELGWLLDWETGGIGASECQNRLHRARAIWTAAPPIALPERDDRSPALPIATLPDVGHRSSRDRRCS